MSQNSQQQTTVENHDRKDGSGGKISTFMAVQPTQTTLGTAVPSNVVRLAPYTFDQQDYQQIQSHQTDTGVLPLLANENDDH